MGTQTIQPVEPRAQAAAPAAVPANPPQRAIADQPSRAQRPELPDYQAYTYGYPPVSGRMLGSGN